MRAASEPTRTFQPRPRDRVLAVAIVLGLALVVVGFSVFLFGLAIPSEVSSAQGGVRAVRSYPAAPILADGEPFIYVCFDAILICGLIGLGIWSLYRLFLYFADDLDETGHWNKAISERHPRYPARLARGSTHSRGRHKQ